MAKRPVVNRKLWRDVGIGAVLIVLIILVSAVPGRFTGPDGLFSTGNSEPTDRAIVETALVEAELVYIRNIVPVISSWDVSRIRALMVQSTLGEISEQEMEIVLTTLGNELGALQSYSEPEKVSRHSLPSASGDPGEAGEESYASYQFDAVYEKGLAHVTLELVEQGTRFELLAMNIVIKDGTPV